VWLIDSAPPGLWYALLCRSHAFCYSYHLFIPFPASRPGMVMLSVYRASNVWGDAHNRICLVLQLESAEYLERRRAALNEAGRSASVIVNEGTRIPRVELNTFHLYQHYSLLCTTEVHLTWGLLRVCAACQTPRLNLRFELRPYWNNTHDTFPTGTTSTVLSK
jgi:hypothetical protein